MKIAFAASEGVPFCKTGGLADVVGALSKSLAEARHDVLVFLPLYKEVSPSKWNLKKCSGSLFIPVGQEAFTAQLWVKKMEKRRSFYFIDCPRFFNRDGLYGYAAGVDFSDNDKRYVLFCLAVLEAVKKLNWTPDVIHTHDWHTGLLSSYLSTIYSDDPFFRKTASIFSIHNMAYQGLFPTSSYERTGLPSLPNYRKSLEFKGWISFLKAGLVYSNGVNAVSPTYAKEISTRKEFGYGFEPVIKARKNRFRGILNGLDVDYWNPQTDRSLKSRYSVKTLSKREVCRKNLQASVGFPQIKNVPILGFVGRMEVQKGLNVVLSLIPKLVRAGAQIICLGRGNVKYERKLKQYQREFRNNLFYENAFQEPLAHKIYAGSDLFLMPSLFEPCGLGQLIAMRYGSLPVVTPTGGLKDTVVDLKSRKGTGFVSSGRDVASYRKTLTRALQFIQDPKRKKAAQIRAMEQDWSWDRSQKTYIQLYENAKRWKGKN